MRRCLVAFVLVPGLLGTVVARGAETSSPDEQLLKAAGLPTDGGGLLAFFHMRTHPEEERALIPSLIEQLGAGTSDARNPSSKSSSKRGSFSGFATSSVIQ